MKLRGTLFFTLLLGVTLFVSFFPHSKAKLPDQKETVLVRTMMAYVSQLHFNPKALNDAFSKDLYTYYLENLDGSRRFLTQEDLQVLGSFQYLLDDEIQKGEINFFDSAYSRFNASLLKTQEYYREILSKPFDFNEKETFELDGDKRSYAKNDAELKDLWRKYLKYETLNRVIDKMEAQEAEPTANAEIPKKSMEELEKEAREATLKSYDDLFGRLQKVKRSDRFGDFLNAISAMYDPHTEYFAPIEKQNFDIRFSGRLEGIGATLQTQGEYTKVSSIVVGGPAWKGKELQENDLILKVAQGTDGEFQDIGGMVVNDVVQLVRGKKGTIVRLQVKKVDGSVKMIQIVRDLVQIEDTYVRSLLLDSPNGEKAGYIYLPSFYASFDDPNGRFCSKDVAAELEKLKAENVDGIILDLRNNGGGSLRDVQRMTGFFVESGPVVQVKSRDSQPEILKDVDTRVQYTGPLIVMVNTLSASASEIMAAALQDYGRALIVGNPTFGKGSVQRFYNLDNGIPNNPEWQPLGEVKITTQKFYRINGGSVQLKGVTPDIVLPDEYQLIEVGERQESHPLEWTQIPAVDFSQNVFRIKNLEDLKRKSKARIASDETFRKVAQNAKRIKDQRDATLVPLNLGEYRAQETAFTKSGEAFKDFYPAEANKNVRNLPADLAAINANESDAARNSEFLKSVSRDIYLRETLQILHDLIKQ